MDDKKKQLLNKLKALAERGVGGEKETAQRKLQELMEKYEIDENDLSDDKKEKYQFKYKNEFEKKLIKQIELLRKNGLKECIHIQEEEEKDLSC